MSLEILPFKDPVSGGAVGGASNLVTTGAVPYVSAPGVLNQDASNLFWDATNHRLGIGTNAPSQKLAISDSSSATAAIHFLNNSGGGGSVGYIGAGAANGLITGGLVNGLQISSANSIQMGILSGASFSIANSKSVGIGTLNTSPTGTLHVYDATASTGVTTLTVKAGAAQSSTNLQEWQNSSGTVLASISSGGNIDGAQITSSGGTSLRTNGNILLKSNMGYIIPNSDGVWQFTDNATTSFGRLQFGGTTSSFPALKRSTTGLIARLADDSADTWVKVKSIITGALTVATLPAAPTAGERAFVTDSNAASYTAGIGAIVAAGGTTAVPVVYDGTNWRIG